jgi:Ca2+-binding RTX toxin-like protein
MAEIIGTAASDVLNGGAGDDKISGLAGNDTLNGGAGVDELDGGAGNDRMAGGASDDIYIVDSANDVVVEAANQGFDSVLSSVDHTLAANVEDLAFLGVGNLSGVGNALRNKMTGNLGQNHLDGGAGNDELFGVDGDDLLIGGTGNDHHDGGSGDDTMQGGLGNDSYIVRSAGDQVIEAAGQGTDLIFSFLDIDLSKFANVENVNLVTGAVAATGNELNNRIVGNAAANVLDGGVGNDTLLGLGGSDTLAGGLGNDELDGGTGLDQMSGGAGNDTYLVDDADDIVIEDAGEGIDTVRSTVDFTLSANVENLILTGNAQVGGGNDVDNVITAGKTASQLSGFGGNDTLNGGADRDQLDGGTGNDRMAGGGEDDTYVVDSGKDIVIEAANQGFDSIISSVDYALGAHVEELQLVGNVDLNGVGNTLNNVMFGNDGGNRLDGGAGNDTLFGGDGGDLLIGGAGNDELDGQAGDDTMQGGLGNDEYTVDSADDKVSEAAGQGIDTIFGLTDVDLSQFANVENATLLVDAQSATGNALNNKLTGNDFANLLLGGAGNDTLDGAGDADTLRGGVGNDTYVVDDDAATVIENDKEGIDLVQSSVDFTLGANIENLTLIAAGNGVQTGRGNALGNVIIGSNDPSDLFGEGGNDTLTGGIGEDILDGGVGNDRMTGGGGDDVYFVDSTKDVAIEAAKQGLDIVKSSVDFTLSANVEDLELIGAGNLKGVGNTLANDLAGNAGNNRLDGGAGNDTIGGADGEDTLLGGAGDDRLVGANDAAKDILNGGAGNDVYVISDTLDVVIEGAGQGTDTILGLIDINLSKHANVENVTLEVFAVALAATGNALNNRITGNIRDNMLLGLDGNDTLDGGLGVDTLRGGLGNDVYVVTDGLDTVTENAKEGTDRVESSITFFLAANIENLTLTGANSIDGIGNELANVIIGNGNSNGLFGDAGNDILRGGGGADTLDGEVGADRMFGEAGNDEYFVDNVGDVVTENANHGIDLVQSSVSFTLGANIENLSLFGNNNTDGIGNALDNDISGNSAHNRLIGGGGNDVLAGFFGNDTMDGGAGNDRIEGGRGADVMTGGAGADAFVYKIDALAELGLIAGDTINGFQHGVDKVDLNDILSDFGIGANDAFTGGFLKIDIVGSDTRILFDSNGGGDGFITLATLNNVTNVTADDLTIQAT